jgi:hypothetical protein
MNWNESQSSASTLLAPMLSEEQKAQFIRDGFLVQRGLLPTKIVEATRDAILDSPHWPQTDSDLAGTSGMSVPLWGATAPTKACRTPKIEQLAEELVGPHFSRGESLHYGKELAGFPTREEGFVPVITFPTAHTAPGPPRFAPPTAYHIDGYPDPPTLWPNLLFVVVFAYLTDTAEYGGATVVRPGSHRQVFEYWHERGIEGGHQLPPLEYSAPLPLPGKAGDVIFMHYLMVHSGSTNFSDHPRVGMNTAIMPNPALPYQSKTGAPDESWTPLDWTLRAN